jgi:hypothetical protein
MNAMGIEGSISTAIALSILMMAMSAALLPLTIVGLVGAAALAGVGVMAVLITAIGALIVGIGYLADKTPELQKWLDTGIPILEKIGYALGSFFGNMIGGFFGGMASGLPAIAKGLSEFMLNLNPFLVGANSINPAAMDGIKSLAQAILILTAADVLDGMTRWFAGGNAIDQFGSQLPALGGYLKEFSKSLDGFTEDDVKMVGCAADAIKVMADAAKDIPNEGGWAGAIFGENGIGAFAEQMPKVGTNLATFAKTLVDGGFTGDSVGIVEHAAKAIAKMADVAKDIPNEGGWAAAIFGDNSIGGFTEQMPGVGTNLAEFAKNLGSFTLEHVTAIGFAALAIKKLAEAATGIDGQTEFGKILFGDNSIGAFASQMPGVGTNLAEFAKNLGTFNESQVNTITSAVAAITSLSDLSGKDLKDIGKKLPDFGGKLPAVAKDIRTFCNEMPTKSSVDAAIGNIEKILNVFDKVTSSDSGDAASFATSLKTFGAEGVRSFVNALKSSSAIAGAKSAAQELIGAAIFGVESKHDKLKTAFTDGVQSGIDAINKKYQTLCDAGSYLVSGFSAGISENTWKAEAQARAMAKAAAQAAEAELKINSPSKVFMGIGSGVVEGFVKGVSDNQVDSLIAVNGMAKTATQGFSDAIRQVSELLDGDMDVRPTIRPVLDLSDVRTGAGSISSILNSRNSVNALAAAGTISMMMRNQNQNGANYDVVSAIDKLRDYIGGLDRNTYNINGLSYSGDGELDAAFQTIIRAARLERRS